MEFVNKVSWLQRVRQGDEAAWEDIVRQHQEGVYLRALGRELVYPPTPDLAGSLRQRHFRVVRRHCLRRRVAWGLMSTLLALVLIVATVPQARAAVVKAMRLGGGYLDRG